MAFLRLAVQSTQLMPSPDPVSSKKAQKKGESPAKARRNSRQKSEEAGTEQTQKRAAKKAATGASKAAAAVSTTSAHHQPAAPAPVWTAHASVASSAPGVAGPSQPLSLNVAGGEAIVLPPPPQAHDRSMPATPTAVKAAVMAASTALAKQPQAHYQQQQLLADLPALSQAQRAPLQLAHAAAMHLPEFPFELGSATFQPAHTLATPQLLNADPHPAAHSSVAASQSMSLPASSATLHTPNSKQETEQPQITSGRAESTPRQRPAESSKLEPPTHTTPSPTKAATPTSPLVSSSSSSALPSPASRTKAPAKPRVRHRDRERENERRRQRKLLQRSQQAGLKVSPTSATGLQAGVGSLPPALVAAALPNHLVHDVRSDLHHTVTSSTAAFMAPPSICATLEDREQLVPPLPAALPLPQGMVRVPNPVAPTLQPRTGLSQTEPTNVHDVQQNTPTSCLMSLLDAGLLRPGPDSISVDTEQFRYYADLYGDGCLAARSAPGHLFSTPDLFRQHCRSMETRKTVFPQRDEGWLRADHFGVQLDRLRKWHLARLYRAHVLADHYEATVASRLELPRATRMRRGDRYVPVSRTAAQKEYKERRDKMREAALKGLEHHELVQKNGVDILSWRQPLKAPVDGASAAATETVDVSSAAAVASQCLADFDMESNTSWPEPAVQVAAAAAQPPHHSGSAKRDSKARDNQAVDSADDAASDEEEVGRSPVLSRAGAITC